MVFCVVLIHCVVTCILPFLLGMWKRGLDACTQNRSVTCLSIETHGYCLHALMPWLRKPVLSIWYQYRPILASFPGLHAQLLSLAVRKAGEDLDGFITWCMPRLTSCTVASHDWSSSNLTCRTSWTERTNWIQGKKSEGERTNPDVSRLNMMSAAARIHSSPAITPCVHACDHCSRGWIWCHLHLVPRCHLVGGGYSW